MTTIGKAFAEDHRRLEAELSGASSLIEAEDWPAASARFVRFREGIERHIEVEEQVLFPAVENGAEIPLTAILRKGHRDLKVFFDEVEDAILDRDQSEALRIISAMCALLERHDKKEEAELYPVAQERLGTAGAASISEALHG